MTPAPTTSADTETGPRRGRLGYVVIGLVVAVAAAGWAFVMANAGRTPGISAETVAFKILDDSAVELKYRVAKPKDRAVRCVLDAIDRNFAPVARTETVIPAGVSEVERTVTLRTTKRANAARVKDCRRV
ncbi:DUF4307 domain-containing protein [Actinomadura craniellae]|uniref:DUF4307 domain-containing protein n=1 Tax=Actinomadura craniellae TaxID=2231787 RepID=A0A365H7X3_9ACTN|nr:DUF4307 domain-containing protein [Actinomadura craniellae]RAY14363.1 DUF4307 domain-containing protein [Actinomadura craniellae]